jgi:hypothetical protein
MHEYYTGPHDYYTGPHDVLEIGESLIWEVVVQPGEQVAIFRGSNLKTGDTTDGGSPKVGTPSHLILNLFHDALFNWTVQHGIGPTAGAAAAVGVRLPTYPVPPGPGPYPPATSGLPVSLSDDLIVQHDGLNPNTLFVLAVVVASPGGTCR